MNLPEQARETIFHTSGEEYAWKRDDIADVVEALTEENYAILGGEAWTIENGIICPTLPLPSGGTAIFAWDTDKRVSETWEQFVRRAAEETISLINKYDTEDELPPEKSEFVCYNLTYVTESEYLELCEEIKKQ
ncbi:MAG: Imm40 family immunity protein [Aridibacter sp.]